MQARDPWQEKTDLRLASVELDISALQAQLASICRTLEINRTIRAVETADPRTVRAERAHRHIARLAEAIHPGAWCWSTALAVRMTLTGEDLPPPGLEGTVAALRDHYPRPPAQNTIWRILRDCHDFHEIAAVAGAG